MATETTAEAAALQANLQAQITTLQQRCLRLENAVAALQRQLAQVRKG